MDSYSSYIRLLGYTQQNVNSAANFVFTSKTGLSDVKPFYDSHDNSCQDLIISKAMFTGWNPRGTVQQHSFPK